MAGSTPTREARSSRLGNKPYDRPSSANSSATNTPHKPANGGGLLRSLVGKLYSPFNSRNTAPSRHADDQDDRKESKDAGSDDGHVDDNGSDSRGPRDVDAKMQFNDDYEPIKPILEAVNSLTPITPERSTILLATFMANKQALGQAGQQSPEEQRAISELLRRATEDNGGSSILGLSTASGASRSPVVSKTGRGLFDFPARDKGVVRSNSYDVLAGSPSRTPAGPKSSLGSPARSWRPLQASTLGHSQSSATESPAKRQQQSSEQRATAHSLSAYNADSKPSNTPFAPRQPSALSKSTSMFTMSHHARSEASPDLGKSSNKQAAAPAPVTETSQNPPRQIKSAAARTLEGLLNKVETETHKKLNVEPISNPYEGYRFHIGSSTTDSSKRPSQSGPSSSRPRTSLKPRPRASLAPPAPNTSKMSDLELIEASMDAEQQNKRARKASPKQTSRSKETSETSDHMQVDEFPPASTRSRNAATQPKAQRTSYPILARPESPAKKQPLPPSQLETTTPKQPPPSRFSAFDIISRTIGSSAETETKKRPSVSFAPISQVEPIQVPEQPKATSPAKTSSMAPAQTPENTVKKLDVGVLPVSTFRSLANVPDLSKDTSALARQQALAKSIDKLPTFTFTFKIPSVPPSSAASTSLPSTGFTGWGSGLAPQASTNDTWECLTCMCKSKATSTKCDVCETPRPAANATSATSNAGFTGWGVGAQVPSTASDDWTCSTCLCKSKASSTNCDVCDTPRPGGASVAKSTNTGFTGWGTGMQDKGKSSGTWTCSVCGLQSKETSSKCDVCETPR